MEHMPAQGGTIPMQRPCIVEDCPANGGCPLDGLLPGWLGWDLFLDLGCGAGGWDLFLGLGETLGLFFNGN